MSIDFFIPAEPISWTRVTLEGPDAKDFLHRLTTVDVRNLADGSGAPGLFLTSQGKIRASFMLWSAGQGRFVFELDAGADGHWKKELLLAIDQYTFAEKMTLTPDSPLACRWILGAEIAGLGDGQTQVLGPVELFHHGSRDFGRPWISIWGSDEDLDAWIAANAPDARKIDWPALDRERIQRTRPWVGTEISESVIPLELGLKDAIADQKGCYPGQEVIEKIVALGSPPRRLVRIDGIAPTPEVGDPVLDLSSPAVEVGKLTSVTTDGTTYSALALMKKAYAKNGNPVLLDPDGRMTGKVVAVAEYK